MREGKCFKVNEYIILKLEDGQSNIYIHGDFFYKYKKHWASIPPNKAYIYNNLDLMDKITENDNFSKANFDFTLTPEQEFRTHCSSLQIWDENEYDTRLLHTNLAFSMLKELIDSNDLRAKKVFKSEIIEQLTSGHPSTIRFLINGGYLNYLNQKELVKLLDLCNNNLKLDSLAKGKQICYHTLFFKLRGQLGSQKIKEWRENLAKKDTSKGDLFSGFDLFFPR